MHTQSEQEKAPRWYLLASKAKEEDRALLNLKEQGYTAYLPIVEREHRRRGKLTMRVEPLFPRYLFIRLDKKSDEWAPIRSTFGVSGLVRFGSKHSEDHSGYIPIPDAVIELLRSHEDENGIHQLEKAKWFKEGDKVRVTSGPFAELEGVFVVDDGKHRSMILLDMMGKQQHITLESSQLAATKYN